MRAASDLAEAPKPVCGRFSEGSPDRVAPMLTPIPVAVVGMAGAGKSEVSSILVESYGFQTVYFGQVVLDEIIARNLPVGAASEQLVREELRAAEGMDVMAARTLPRIRSALSQGLRVCVDGLYSGAEWELLARECGVLTFAVHAPRWLRKLRLAERPTRPLTGAELDRRDLSEVEHLDKAKPIALADAHVLNDGDLDDLRRGVARFISHVDEVAAARVEAA